MALNPTAQINPTGKQRTAEPCPTPSRDCAPDCGHQSQPTTKENQASAHDDHRRYTVTRCIHGHHLEAFAFFFHNCWGKLIRLVVEKSPTALACTRSLFLFNCLFTQAFVGVLGRTGRFLPALGSFISVDSGVFLSFPEGRANACRGKPQRRRIEPLFFAQPSFPDLPLCSLDICPVNAIKA